MQLRDAHGWELWFRRVRVARLTAKRLGRWLTEDGFAVPDRTMPDGPIAVRHAAPELRVELQRVQREGGQDVDHDHATRDTRIWRRVWAGHELVEEALIVDDHQRIPAELRTCLDCGELACRARITIPEAV